MLYQSGVWLSMGYFSMLGAVRIMSTRRVNAAPFLQLVTAVADRIARCGLRDERAGRFPVCFRSRCSPCDFSRLEVPEPLILVVSPAREDTPGGYLLQ